MRNAVLIGSFLVVSLCSSKGKRINVSCNTEHKHDGQKGHCSMVAKTMRSKRPLTTVLGSQARGPMQIVPGPAL